jgi:hypothetical protein
MIARLLARILHRRPAPALVLIARHPGGTATYRVNRRRA